VFDSTINSLFGCGHKRITFPRTPARDTQHSTGQRHGTYVVCLECGQEFQYDWRQMTIGDPIPIRPYAAPLKAAPHALTIRKAEMSQNCCGLDF
jgi:DNA-directed RNA polymerase subunit RPC12/RpoP